MHPFADGQVYVRNAWYMAAWSAELGKKPLGRTIMDEPVVFYRTSQGDAVAMWGLCGHRYFPLAGAEVVGDHLMCPYHGFTYDRNGACVRIPAQTDTPTKFRLKTYPLLERFGAIWIWMGEPAKADAAAIPALDRIGCGLTGWKFLPNGMTHIKARWPLVIDNLMDLSHVGFLHKTTIQQPDAGEAKPIFEGAPEFRCVRWLPNQKPDVPYYRYALPNNNQLVDGEMDSRFFSPGLIVTSLLMYSALDSGPQRLLASIYHLHGITPETRGSTHDFSGVARNVELNSAKFDDWQKAAAHAARVEDAAALERIEPSLDRYANTRTELSSVSDQSAIRVRRHLASLIAL
jgi:phenylpropionate dioxygenase-like ring-hydroxylating dioxygenase large terminal subunit